MGSFVFCISEIKMHKAKAESKSPRGGADVGSKATPRDSAGAKGVVSPRAGDAAVAAMSSSRVSARKAGGGGDITVGSARSSVGPATDRSPRPESSNGDAGGGGVLETSRDYMSTARVHTALAALTAEKQELLAKLSFIESTLEAEGKKKLMRARGYKVM